MHSKGFIHRDLKTANILLRGGKQGEKYPQVKIADFGLSRNVRQPMQAMTREVQSLWYRAPEIILGNSNYTFAIDYWSIGIIAYELIYLEHRFPGTSEIDTLFKIFKQKGTPDFTNALEFPHPDDHEHVDSQFKVVFPKFQKPNNVY